MNHDEIFNALKKCNQIGKKLATGKYILVSGMMIGYDELDPLETEAYGLSVCFIENKLLSKMNAIPYIGIEIDGNELYQVSQECKFIKFTVDSNYLNIEFDMVTTTDSSFNDEFMNLAIDKGYDKNFGARPLKRAIQTYIEDTLADYMLRDNSQDNTTIELRVDRENDSIEVVAIDENKVLNPTK